MKKLETFASSLNALSPSPIAEQDVVEAHRNLSGFMSVLLKVNEREKVVIAKGASG